MLFLSISISRHTPVLTQNQLFLHGGGHRVIIRKTISFQCSHIFIVPSVCRNHSLGGFVNKKHPKKERAYFGYKTASFRFQKGHGQLRNSYEGRCMIMALKTDLIYCAHFSTNLLRGMSYTDTVTSSFTTNLQQ